MTNATFKLYKNKVANCFLAISIILSVFIISVCGNNDVTTSQYKAKTELVSLKQKKIFSNTSFYKYSNSLTQHTYSFYSDHTNYRTSLLFYNSLIKVKIYRIVNRYYTVPQTNKLQVIKNIALHTSSIHPFLSARG